MEAAISEMQLSVAYCLHGNDYFLSRDLETVISQEKWHGVVVTCSFGIYFVANYKLATRWHKKNICSQILKIHRWTDMSRSRREGKNKSLWLSHL